VFIGAFGGDNSSTHPQQFVKMAFIPLQPNRLCDCAFKDRGFV